VSATFLSTGTVVTPEGEPVQGAFVTIAQSSVPVPEIAVVTDAGGRFQLRLPAGRFTLRAHAGGHVTDTAVETPRDTQIDIVLRERD
jgi:hypothetical protein